MAITDSLIKKAARARKNLWKSLARELDEMGGVLADVADTQLEANGLYLERLNSIEAAIRELTTAVKALQPAAASEPVDAAPKLQLEVGKEYVLRNGQTVVITEYDPAYEYDRTSYPFLADNGRSYLADGTYDANEREHSRDIVAEAPCEMSNHELAS